MKLFWTPASPFTRKVCVAARELELWDRIEVLPTTWPLEWGYQTVEFTPGLAQANPVARIPTLITTEGEALCDSTLACLHLHALAPHKALIAPGAAAWPMWSVYGVADGLIEAQIGMRAEHLRPRDQRSQSYLVKQTERIERCFEHLQARLAVFEDGLNLASITVGIACGYQIWRDWLTDFRPCYPALAAWYENFAQRDAMRATEPRETPER